MNIKQKPVDVAPLIRGARWTFLVLGVIYAQNKLILYRTMERTLGPKRQKEIDDHAAHIKEENIKSLSAGLILGASIFGVELPPNFRYEE